MLKLDKITKIYKIEDFEQRALDSVSIDFRQNEFVSILGPSGSGKTTLLNIIGGLDHYTSGDLIINGVSTKEYNDRDLDTYRNHLVGFVFQSYNLIPHQTILSNVELSLTLSGVKKQERRKRAKEALKKVGLIDHINKKPNQLSGGQMQRVAIARALVNDPEIVLADEPTGALDSSTSTQVMDLLKEIAKDKLVVMVTHNEELAKEYSTRIIELKDGKMLSDSNPYNEEKEKEHKDSKTKKTSMSFLTALSLSLNNLMTKKARTILTAFAGSIGIVGIALILSLSNGVQNYINRVQEETLTSYPITIEKEAMDMTSALMESVVEEENEEQKNSNKLYSNDQMGGALSLVSTTLKSNNLEAFKKHIESNETNIKDYVTAIEYDYGVNLQLYSPDTTNGILQVNPNKVFSNLKLEGNISFPEEMATTVFLKMLDNKEMNSRMYDVLSGRMPEAYNEIVLLVDENNGVSDYVLYSLGIKDQANLQEMFDKIQNEEEFEIEKAEYEYEDFLNLSYKLLLNTDYYEKQPNNVWVDKKEDKEYLKNKINEAEELKIVGIIKPSEDSTATTAAAGGILYTKELEEYVIQKINESQIVKEQKENKEINVLTGLKFSKEEFSMDSLSNEQKMYFSTLSPEQIATLMQNYKNMYGLTYDDVLITLGAAELEKPSMIHIYPKDFEAKDEIKNIISKYNEKQEADGKEENVIRYTDLVGILMSSVTVIVDMISYVLIAFVSISLVVSSIMIGIITYISVLERTKEIGILRAMGASKRDISRVFNAETLIIGFVAGMLGIIITVVLNIPINLIINAVAGVNGLSSLPIGGAIILVIISVILTIIAGLIPSSIASKKDPVESLRTE